MRRNLPQQMVPAGPHLPQMQQMRRNLPQHVVPAGRAPLTRVTEEATHGSLTLDEVERRAVQDSREDPCTSVYSTSAYKYPKDFKKQMWCSRDDFALVAE